MANIHYHVRSTSLPTGSHPLTLGVQENLNKLQSWDAIPSTTSLFNPTVKMFCDGLCGLTDLYRSVDDLIQLPLTQSALQHHGQGQWVDELLEDSLRLLDVFETARDVLLQTKEQAKDLQSVFRRRRGNWSEMEKNVGAYFSSKKQIKREIQKCLKVLKRTKNVSLISPIMEKDVDLVAVISALKEGKSIGISILYSILSFMSGSRPGAFRKSLVSKWTGKGRVACEGEVETMNELERIDASLVGLYSCKFPKDDKTAQVQNAQKQLEAFNFNIQCVEDGLDCVFRRLIKIRASILNIVSH